MLKKIYSIRKTTLGVGSVLIGSLLFMGQEAMAQEVSVLPEEDVISKVEVLPGFEEEVKREVNVFEKVEVDATGNAGGIEDGDGMLILTRRI